MIKIIQKDDNTLSMDFTVPVFFTEMMECPSEFRNELIKRILEKYSVWMIDFCMRAFKDNPKVKIEIVKE